MLTYQCDQCDEQVQGERLVISTEASDSTGVHVDVAKRWVLCRPCGDGVFSTLGETSAWDDSDFKTLVLPGDDENAVHAGGHVGLT